MIPDVTAKPARLLSLDAFRGVVIALMFLVNLSGSKAAFPDWFGHAGWNNGEHGQWLADYVFPWFLFIVGVAIPFSMSSGRGAARSTSEKIAAAFKRAVILYFLGVVLFMARTSMDSLDWVGTGAQAVGIDGFAPKIGRAITWGTLLHWDILPLIALGYLLATLLWFTPRWLQVFVVLAVLAGKAAFMPALTDQAGLQRAAWVASRTDWEYQTKSLGWIGTGIAQGLPAMCCTVFGMWAGQLLRSLRGPRSPDTASVGSTETADSDRAARRGCGMLFGAGLALVAASFVMHSLFGHRFSKDFFTSSYVLLSSGSAMALLAFMYWVIDCRGWRGGLTWWFAIMGSNALFIYMVGEVLWTMVWMRWRVLGPDGSGQVMFTALQAHLAAMSSPAAGPWMATAIYIGIYWAASLFMHRKGIVVKV